MYFLYELDILGHGVNLSFLIIIEEVSGGERHSSICKTCPRKDHTVNEK